MATPAGENIEAAAQPEQLEQNASMDASQGQTVPVHVLQSVRDELKAEREKNDAYRNHLDMMRWQQPVQQAPPPNPFNNVDPSDPITVGDAMKAFGELQNRFETKLNEVKMAAKSGDYEETIKKYLPQASKEDPEILDAIKNSINPYKTAYAFCKASKAYQDDFLAQHRTVIQNKPDPDVVKMVANSKQSGNLSAVGNNSTINTNPKYSQMSDQEFRNMKARNMMKPAKFIEDGGRPTR